jgi:hypothetical protein
MLIVTAIASVSGVIVSATILRLHRVGGGSGQRDCSRCGCVVLSTTVTTCASSTTAAATIAAFIFAAVLVTTKRSHHLFHRKIRDSSLHTPHCIDCIHVTIASAFNVRRCQTQCMQ